ncbi:MAG: Asp-tRNA(Asn)/Glu-tRNA(Gln) amidotransferase subunit GatA [Caldisericia bacterium]|nr:Asp-tRNA(Asn)/Glu-tRNA(Gln) amidotransferase subunit GatA [Caldisericia bacterium]
MLSSNTTIQSLHQSYLSNPDSLFTHLRAYTRRIREKNESIRAFLYIQELKQPYFPSVPKVLPPLFGIPIAIKDNIWVDNMPCTSASKMLETFIPPEDATVIKRIKQAGGWISGKTNMDEFAMGSSTENSAFFPTRNPYRLDYVPGGSSGGSTAAVAADMSLCALASDTGGSIRQPASFCGVVGIRPTYGLVSRHGLIGFSSSLDQIGPIARTVEDAFQLLSVIAGYDESDDTSLPVQWKDLTEKKPTTIAVLDEIEHLDMDKGVFDLYQKCKQWLAKHFRIITCHIPSFQYALSAYHIIADSEASSNLSRMGGDSAFYPPFEESYEKTVIELRTSKLGEEVKRRILLGAFTLSSRFKEGYYQHAFYAKEHIKHEFEFVFQQADAIFTPTTITAAFPFGARVDPRKMYYSDICTIPSALAGLPALSIPVGLNENGLPVGMQFIGNHLSEKTLYRLSRWMETNWHA